MRPSFLRAATAALLPWLSFVLPAQAPTSSYQIRVGDGGLTAHELGVYLTRGARDLGKSETALSPAERQAIEQKAIDEEILFQAALQKGVHKEPNIQKSILALYESSQTTARIDPGSFSDAEIAAYHRAHPEKFAAASESELMALQFGAGSGLGEREIAAAAAQAARAPEKAKGWKSLGWVTAGDTLRTPLSGKQLEPVYRLAKGRVSQPIKDSYGTVYVFWCKDSRPAKAQSLAECRAKVVHCMIEERKAKLSAELERSLPGSGSPEQRKWNAAIAAGQHRDWNLRQRVINTFVAGHKQPREQLVESLRSRYRVAAPPR